MAKETNLANEPLNIHSLHEMDRDSGKVHHFTPHHRRHLTPKSLYRDVWIFERNLLLCQSPKPTVKMTSKDTENGSHATFTKCHSVFPNMDFGLLYGSPKHVLGLQNGTTTKSSIFYYFEKCLGCLPHHLDHPCLLGA